MRIVSSCKCCRPERHQRSSGRPAGELGRIVASARPRRRGPVWGWPMILQRSLPFYLVVSPVPRYSATRGLGLCCKGGSNCPRPPRHLRAGWNGMGWSCKERSAFRGLDRTGTDLNDTWTWDGNTWTQQFPPISPPCARPDGVCVRRGNEDLVVLFGGGNSSATVFLGIPGRGME